MSLLSELEPVPVRMVGVLRTLAALPGRRTDLGRLRNLMHPPTVWSRHEVEKSAPNAMVESCLTACVELGLVEPPAGKDADFHIPARAAKELGERTFDDCMAALTRRLLGGASDSSRGDSNEQLCWIAAWYLEQPPEAWPADADSLRNALLPGSWEELGYPNVNESRFGQFLHWAGAMGLLVKLPQGALLVNPAPFLRRHLPDFMEPGRKMSVKDWLGELAKRFRIFEGGAIHAKVPPRPGRRPQTFSSAMTAALLQLEDEGRLKFETVSDGNHHRMASPAEDRVIDYLTWTQGGSR